MPSGILGSFDEFKRFLPASWAKNFADREAAMQTYLAMGGITKVGEMKGSGWPELLYPTSDRLGKQINEVQGKIDEINNILNDLDKRHSKLNPHKVEDFVARVSEPLFWEHQLKMVADPDYKKTHEIVQPPMNLIHRKNWKKRLKMFVKSKEYRLRLKEARKSVIGKKREAMKDEVEKRIDFSKGLVENEKRKLQTKREDHYKKIWAMRVLSEWTKETPTS